MFGKSKSHPTNSICVKNVMKDWKWIYHMQWYRFRHITWCHNQYCNPCVRCYLNKVAEDNGLAPQRQQRYQVFYKLTHSFDNNMWVFDSIRTLWEGRLQAVDGDYYAPPAPWDGTMLSCGFDSTFLGHPYRFEAYVRIMLAYVGLFSLKLHVDSTILREFRNGCCQNPCTFLWGTI